MNPLIPHLGKLLDNDNICFSRIQRDTLIIFKKELERLYNNVMSHEDYIQNYRGNEAQMERHERAHIRGLHAEYVLSEEIITYLNSINIKAY